MEFLELNCTKTKIKNWMQLKADYRPMKNESVNKHSLAFPFCETAMPKNVQTPIQLCSFHMLARLCSKFFKHGYTIMWIEIFQMYKLGFKAAEEPEIKLSTFSGSRRKQRSSRKKSISATLTTLKPLTVWITTSCGKFLKRWKYQTTLPASWEVCMQVKNKQLEPDMEQWTGSKLGKEFVKAVYCDLAYFTYM